jgi:hypothetical protein
MHLKLDGHALVAQLGVLRAKRRFPKATISACPLTMGKVAAIDCGPLHFDVPILDRRNWSGTVEFDGMVFKSLAKLPANDLFMDVCRVEFIGGELIFAECLSASANIVPE